MVWNPAAFNSTVNMSPLLRAIQGFQQGHDQAADFRTQQNVGGRIAAGDWTGAQSEAAKGGMDVPVLVQLGQKARDAQMRAEQAQRYKSLLADPAAAATLGPMMPILNASDPDAGMQLAGQFAMKKPDRDEQRRYHDAQIGLMQARERALQERSRAPSEYEKFFGGLQRHGVSPKFEGEDEGDGYGDDTARGNVDGGPASSRRPVQRPTPPNAAVNDPDILTPTELSMGITIDQKARRLKAEYLSGGRPPKVGHVWDFDQSGRLVQKEVAPKGTKKGDVSPEMIKSTIQQIDQASSVLGGTLDGSGRTKEDGPWSATRFLSDVTDGRIRPEIKQAMNSAHMAAMKSIMAISGKSFSKFELQNDLLMFKPKWSDTDEMSRFKLGTMKDLLMSLQEARTAGLSDEQMAGVYQSAIAKAAARNGMQPQAQPSQPSQPSQPRASGGWSIQRVD